MTPKTPKKHKEDIRKFLRKKGIPSLAKALTKVMPKEHKQRFEHDWQIVSEQDLSKYLEEYQKLGFELVSVTQIKDEEYTLFFKRSV